jgi:hypothetical protein
MMKEKRIRGGSEKMRRGRKGNGVKGEKRRHCRRKRSRRI